MITKVVPYTATCDTCGRIDTMDTGGKRKSRNIVVAIFRGRGWTLIRDKARCSVCPSSDTLAERKLRAKWDAENEARYAKWRADRDARREPPEEEQA